MYYITRPYTYRCIAIGIITKYKSPFTWSKSSIKNLVKVFFNKVLWSVNLHQKLCQRTLMDFDRLWGNSNPSYFSKKNLTDFDGNWPIKTSFWNQDLIQPFCLSLNLPPKGNFDKVFFELIFRHKTLTKLNKLWRKMALRLLSFWSFCGHNFRWFLVWLVLLNLSFSLYFM